MGNCLHDYGTRCMKFKFVLVLSYILSYLILGVFFFSTFVFVFCFLFFFYFVLFLFYLD